jgi:hypothetical protein
VIQLRRADDFVSGRISHSLVHEELQATTKLPDEAALTEDQGHRLLTAAGELAQLAKFGLAMYLGQVLEHGIVNLLVSSGITPGIYANYEQTETVSVALFMKTMGALKRLLMERGIDLTHLENEVIRSVSLRNFLAHHYFRERASALGTREGRKRMLIELDQAVSFFQEVDARLDHLTIKLLEELGILDEMPEAMQEAAKTDFGQPLPGLFDT